MANTYETDYERSQKFNRVVAWLHSFRYRHVVKLFEQLTKEANGKMLKVVDVGSSHSKLFSVLHPRFSVDYTGIELSANCVATARDRYGHNPNFRVLHEDAAVALPTLKDLDVVFALETLEHIPEHDVVRIVETIASARPRIFVCSGPVEVGPAIFFKNFGSLISGYMRHKEYRWRETLWASAFQLDRLPPHGTGHKGFDWRWLAATIRHNMQITRIRRFPFGFVPAAFSASIFITAVPRDLQDLAGT